MTWLAGGYPGYCGIGQPGRLENAAAEKSVSEGHACNHAPPGSS